MSKLLIQSSGRASSTVKHGVGKGGLLVAPEASIKCMKYGLLQGALMGSGDLMGGNSQADVDVCPIFFPSTPGCVLYQTNIGGDAAALATKPLGNGGSGAFDRLVLAAANKDSAFAPYYQHASAGSSEEVLGENVFRVGVSPAFYMKATYSSANVSNVTRIFIGFRKVEAFKKDLAAAGASGADEAYGIVLKAGDINEFKKLNAAAVAEVDTTIDQANNTLVTVEVKVSAAGVCSILVDGVLLNATDHSIAGMTFDDGELVYPEMHAVLTSAATLEVSHFEFGLQSARK